MTGLNMHYQGGFYSSSMSDLQSYAASDLVFMSFDLEPATAEGFYAVSWVQTAQPGGFDYRLDPPVPAGANQQTQIQAQATLDGAASRVVTATFVRRNRKCLSDFVWLDGRYDHRLRDPN